MTGLRPGALAFAVALCAGCSGKPHVVEPAPGADDGPRNVTIYVVSHGWHAGLVVPSDRIEAAIPDLKRRFGDRPAFYEIGWGDKGFYQAPEITSGLTLQALFWSTGAVLHVVALPADPREYFPGSKVSETCLTESEAGALNTFIASSFARREDAGQVVRLARGIYGDSQFYDAVGRYYMINTCNKWTAKGLRSAGMDLLPDVKLTAGSVMRAVESHHKRCDRSTE
jgi:uncharacterized protein (TIGR02117 family)